MNAADAMNAALDASGLHRARLMAAAEAAHNVVDKARRLTEVPDPESEAFWTAFGAMFDAVQLLDGTRPVDAWDRKVLDATVATSEQIVRDHVEVFDLPGRDGGAS